MIKAIDMKKNILYLSLITIFLATVGFVILKYNNKKQEEEKMEYALLPRLSSDVNNAEWLFAKKNTDKLMAKIERNPADTKSLVALANAYITESRISGNTAYYDKAAMATVNKVLLQDAGNFEALTLKALLFLSQHHFADGLAIAQSAQKINPENAFVYGLLVDANLEMGNYAAAVDAADKMVTIRPDLRSYSRIAYLREIHGDYPGAIDAMKMAIEAGAPGQESTEWCRVQLGKLYENTGNTKTALFQYQLSLAARPDYAYALAGLARLAANEKKYDSAVYYYSKANALINDYGMKENLAATLKLSGNNAKAESLYAELINEMSSNAKNENNDASIGHYADREMAYVYLHTGNTDKALEHALAEYNRRPQNIDVNETVAWVYYNRKDYAKAKLFIDKAFITHSINPSLLCIAGLINIKTGEVVKGEEMIQSALKNDPVIPFDLRNDCFPLLAKK
jgi:tetratricopeptide (TPR) repeat protein